MYLNILKNKISKNIFLMITHILHNVTLNVTFQFELPCLKIDKICYMHHIIYLLLHENFFFSIFTFTKINNYHSSN